MNTEDITLMVYGTIIFLLGILVSWCFTYSHFKRKEREREVVEEYKLREKVKHSPPRPQTPDERLVGIINQLNFREDISFAIRTEDGKEFCKTLPKHRGLITPP